MCTFQMETYRRYLAYDLKSSSIINSVETTPYKTICSCLNRKSVCGGGGRSKCGRRELMKSENSTWEKNNRPLIKRYLMVWRVIPGMGWLFWVVYLKENKMKKDRYNLFPVKKKGRSQMVLCCFPAFWLGILLTSSWVSSILAVLIKVKLEKVGNSF